MKKLLVLILLMTVTLGMMAQNPEPVVIKGKVTVHNKENGKDINAAKAETASLQEKLNQANTQASTLQQQIADRDKDIQTLKDAEKANEGVTQKLTDLQAKYDADTKALEKKLEDQRIETAIDKAFADVPFASNLAKKAAIADFKAKGYKLAENGTFTEAASFIEALKRMTRQPSNP